MSKTKNKTSKEKMDFEKAKQIIAKAYLEWYQGHEDYQTDPEFRETINSEAKKILEAEDCGDIVDVFIDACWDLETFVLFIEDLNLPKKIRRELIAIAVDSESEWST
jgi:hypothetical protein